MLKPPSWGMVWAFGVYSGFIGFIGGVALEKNDTLQEYNSCRAESKIHLGIVERYKHAYKFMAKKRGCECFCPFDYTISGTHYIPESGAKPRKEKTP